MTILPSLSERLDRLSSRERRVLLGGAIISALILIGTLIVVPFAGQWTEREAAIEAKAEQLGRLEALVASRDELDRTAGELRDALGRRDRSLVGGSSLPLAGSSLQSLVRSYGQRSRVSILRVEPTGGGGVGGAEATEGSDLEPVALSLTAQGDIHGLVDLLYYIQNGEKLLIVDDLRVNAGLRNGGLLSWTMQLRGFYESRESS